MSTHIHPTAIIHPTAKIDPTASVDAYAIIGPKAELGPDCWVGSGAVVEFARLGKGNKIHPHAFIGTPPQDLKYAGEETWLVMGDNNTVREGATLNRGTSTKETRVGSNCLFMTGTHIAHDCRLGSGIIMANLATLAGHVHVGDSCVFGGFVAVHQFVNIGRYCMLGAGSKIGKDMPSFCMCQGDRATLRGLNLVGMRRAGLHRDTVSAIKEAYRTFFLSGLRVEEAAAKLRAGSPAPEVLEMVAQLETSKRGVTRPAPKGAQVEEEVTL
ncbi:MAG: acyl-ACP--UDP-N-acetylglucosamine O-acyltransferase [Elusimicrobiota bacterium]|jgi:UDP-N-acetylglucosamine acyltransferase